MHTKRKHLIWIVPLLIALILFSIQYAFQVQAERQLPNKGWSRTIQLPIITKEGKEFTYADQKGYHLYTYTGKTIFYSKMNPELQVISQKKHVFNRDITHIFWGHNNQYIYKKDQDIYFFNGSKEILLAKDAGPTFTDGTLLYYGKDNELYQTDLKTRVTKPLKTFTYPIQTIYLGTDHNLLITTQNVDRNRAYFFYITMNQGQVVSYPFATYLLGNNSHINQNTAYIPHDGHISLYFVESSPKGGYHTLQYYLEMPYKKIKSNHTMEFNPDPIMIYYAGTENNISSATDISFSVKDGKPTLLFEAEGLRTKRDNAVNIYEATLNENGKWEAERRSTTIDSTISPFWIGQDAIGWYSYTTKGIYQIEATSQNQAVIKKSLELRGEDFSIALSDSLLALTRVLLLIFLSLIFGVGGLFVYAIIAFTKVDWIDNEVPIVKWLVILLFLIGEIWLSHRVMTPTFSYFAPSYLTFKGNFLIIPILTAGLSFYLLRSLRIKDWGLLSFVSIFGVFYITIYSFLIGPYYF